MNQSGRPLYFKTWASTAKPLKPATKKQKGKQVLGTEDLDNPGGPIENMEQMSPFALGDVRRFGINLKTFPIPFNFSPVDPASNTHPVLGCLCSTGGEKLTTLDSSIVSLGRG